MGKATGRLGILVYTKQIFTQLIKVTLQFQRLHVFEVAKFVLYALFLHRKYSYKAPYESFPQYGNIMCACLVVFSN